MRVAAVRSWRFSQLVTGVLLLVLLPSGAVTGPARAAGTQAFTASSGQAELESLLAAWVAARPGLGLPAFTGWYDESLVFAGSSSVRPRQFPGPPLGAGLPAAARAPHLSDAPLVRFVHYNEAAFRHIRSHALHCAAALERLRIAGPVDEQLPGMRRVPSFPPDAAVVMSGWWPVAAQGDTALPVWDPAGPTVRRHGSNDYTQWPALVAVNPQATSGRSLIPRLDFAGRQFTAVPRYGTGDFVAVRLSAAEAGELMREPGVSKAVRIVLGRPLAAGDYLVLVAVHAMAPRGQHGLWATLWWDPATHASATTGTWRAQRGWERFRLTVAVDAVEPVEPDGTPRIAFNPWFEGHLPQGGDGNGLVSNCVNCHHRAGYPRIDFLPVRRGVPDLAGDPAYAAGRLRTAMLWSLGNPQADATAADRKQAGPTASRSAAADTCRGSR